MRWCSDLAWTDRLSLNNHVYAGLRRVVKTILLRAISYPHFYKAPPPPNNQITKLAGTAYWDGIKLIIFISVIVVFSIGWLSIIEISLDGFQLYAVPANLVI
jgi:hypothetical protein